MNQIVTQARTWIGTPFHHQARLKGKGCDCLGLGEIHGEIFSDVQFHITPLTRYRGHPPADLEALEEALLRVSRLVEEIPEISELDLNPIFALPPGQGCWIVDARIRVENGSASV